MNFDKDNPNIYWKRVTIPKGLPAILEALAKESMRENPEELIPFLCKVVDDLIAKRDQDEVQEKGDGRSGANTESEGGGGVSLIKTSKIGSGKRKPDEENPLLEKETTKPQYTAEVDEELAASKIQAGFRGYQTRKLLKESNVTAKGGGLSLTSLTPLQQDALADTPQEEDDNESATDKTVINVDDDEAIAAELKTPLETIREESLDGSLRMKTPEVVNIENAEAPLLSADIFNQPILEEEGENSAAQDDEEDAVKEPEELPEDDANPDETKEKDSEPILAEEESSETPVVSKDLSFEEQTPDSLGSLNKSSDKDEQSSEAEAIGETEIETLVEETDSKLNVEQDELLPETVAGEAEERNEIAPEELVAPVPEDAPQAVENNETPEAIEEEEIAGSSLVSSAELEEQTGEVAIVVDTAEDDAIVIEAEEEDTVEDKAGEEDSEKVKPEEVVDTTMPDSPSKKPDENEADKNASAISPEVAKEEIEDIPKTPDAVEEKLDTETSTSEVAQNAESDKNDATEEVNGTPEGTLSPKPEDPSSPVPEPPVTSPSLEDEPAIPPTEEESKENNAEVTEDSGESTEKVGESSDDALQDNKEDELPSSPQTADPTDSDKPDLAVTIPVSNLLTESESFANTDSRSSSTTTTVRVLADKNEDSSQDASSLPESDAPPIPKPRPPKQTESTPLPEMESPKRQRVEPQDTTECPEESEVVAELPEAPVKRRQKSSQSRSSRSGSSKYRSGLVLDDEVSMEEMEAQIENEMLSQAATKIQAGFRGYKTRKSFRQSGVSSNAAEDSAAAAPPPPESLSLAAPETAAVEAAGNSGPVDTTAETNSSSQELPVSGASAAFSYEESFRPRRAHEGSCPPETTTSSNSKPSLALLRSRSYPGSAEGDALIEVDELPQPQPDVEYDPDYINNAATVIQATIRGFLVRKRHKINRRNKREVVCRNDSYEDVANPNEPEYHGLIINPADRDSLSPVSDVDSDKAAVKIQAAFRGYKDRQKVRKTKKAVVTIQATVRGFLARRRLAKSMRRRSMQRRRSSAKLMSQEIQKMQKVNDAATKIQAVYRGYQVRSKIRKNPNDE